MKALRDGFRKPPLDQRGAPFWSWNDRLDPSELARQARDMKDHGMGGFFMHSRDGLETVYMGDKWLECIRETVRVAREEGMGAWLYDEDRWPSGAAGGLVPARGGDAYRAKVLTVEETDACPQDTEHVLATFVAALEDGTIQQARRLGEGEQPGLGEDEVLLVFRRRITEPSEWFNNDTYSDNLNPDAVAAFIDITYEAYKSEVGKDFGGAVPGIFTDEPNVFASRGAPDARALPWTDAMPTFFAERRGYDLLDVVPWLFYEGEHAAKARHDYWWSVSERFTNAFSKQLGEWCERNGLAFTGHYLSENELGTGITRGGALMPHYRYQHVPGIDMLTEQTHEYLTIKQCTSAANQFGRDRVLSETYGCSSWEFTFEGQKWVGDWQYVLGVNLRCQHLALYTLRGCRKRDYPPAFNYNTTWWKYNGVVEDYFARIGYMMTQGNAVRDVLVLHPTATGWSMLGEDRASVTKADRYGERLNSFAQAVLATHYDFDFGDEQIMADEAAVEGGTLRVGRAPYKVVVIPPETHTLLASTVELLEAFVQAGGRVIAVEPTPTAIEAEESQRVQDLFAREGVTVIPDTAALQFALEQALPRRVSITTDKGQQAGYFVYMQRTIDNKMAYFVWNGDRHNGYTVEFELEGSGRVEEWDPLTGEITPRPTEQLDGMVRFGTRVGPAGSCLYVIDPEGEPVAGDARAAEPDIRALRRTEAATFIGPETAFTRTDPNVLTLDMCRYRMGDEGEWSEKMEVWRAQNAVRQALDMRPNYYNGLPQRYKWALDPHPNDGTPVAWRFAFDVAEVPRTQVHLLIEGAPQYTIELNGQDLPSEPVGWYLDRSFHKVPLSGLQRGENTLILRCGYTNYMEVEDCFLIGDFGVDVDRTIIAEPDTLHFGDWTTQGYLHYAGSMIYHGTLDYEPHGDRRVRLYLGDYEAVDVAIHVNGTLAGHIPWASANGLDITDHLGEGVNNVDIEVVSSPRNMLGPLHLAPGREPWTDWRSFRRTDDTYTPDYVVKSWGLIGQVRLQSEPL